MKAIAKGGSTPYNMDEWTEEEWSVYGVECEDFVRGGDKVR